jgi:hypothetical protein
MIAAVGKELGGFAQRASGGRRSGLVCHQIVLQLQSSGCYT